MKLVDGPIEAPVDRRRPEATAEGVDRVELSLRAGVPGNLASLLDYDPHKWTAPLPGERSLGEGRKPAVPQGEKLAAHFV